MPGRRRSPTSPTPTWPARDARNRGLLFSPDVDQVWAQIERLIGLEQTEAVRGLLLDNDDPHGAAGMTAVTA